MATSEQILNNEFELLKNDLISRHDSKGMRASGDTADSLEVVSSLDSVKLIGSSVWGALEDGRSPSTVGSKPGKLIDQIKQWIKDKGIVSDIKNDNNNSTLAYLITRKIHKQGWNRQGYGGVNVVSEVITTQRIQSIINKVGAELTLTLVTRLKDELKNIRV